MPHHTKTATSVQTRYMNSVPWTIDVATSVTSHDMARYCLVQWLHVSPNACHIVTSPPIALRGTVKALRSPIPLHTIKDIRFPIPLHTIKDIRPHIPLHTIKDICHPIPSYPVALFLLKWLCLYVINNSFIFYYSFIFLHIQSNAFTSNITSTCTSSPT